jgi:hypothetical protein
MLLPHPWTPDGGGGRGSENLVPGALVPVGGSGVVGGRGSENLVPKTLVLEAEWQVRRGSEGHVPEWKTARFSLNNRQLYLRQVLHGFLHCFDRIFIILQVTVQISLVGQHIEVPMPG